MNDGDAIKSKLPISESTKRRNPSLFLRADPSSQFHTQKPQCDQRSEGENSGVEAGTTGVRYRVSFIVSRTRMLDNHDNARSACKKLADLVTEALGLASDGDGQIEFEYHQCKSRLKGTTITIWTEQ